MCAIVHAKQQEIMNASHDKTSKNAITHDEDDNDYLRCSNLFISARNLACCGRFLSGLLEVFLCDLFGCCCFLECFLCGRLGLR